MDPSFAQPHLFLRVAYYHKNMYQEAVGELLKGETALGRSPQDESALRSAYETSGMRGFRQKLIELKKRPIEGYTSPVDIAYLYSALGDRHNAFEWLERAYRERDPGMITIKVEPFFDNLRSDPRFTDLLRRVGLPQ